MEVARRLLGNLGRVAGLVEQAVAEVVSAGVTAGVPLEDVADWAVLPAQDLAGLLEADHDQPATTRTTRQADTSPESEEAEEFGESGRV